MNRLAIITSHPIQYHSPWFSYMSEAMELQIKVFYLWDFGVTEQVDKGFQKSVQWDIPLLSGYEYEFVPNVSRDPGTHHFRGLDNPTLVQQVVEFDPDAVLLIGYNYSSFFQFIWRWNRRRAPLLFRGDSHLLGRAGKGNLKQVARRQAISFIFRRFAAFLYVGEANRQYLEYHHVPQRKLFFAPHAVDNERFLNSKHAFDEAARWKQELGIPKGHSVILFAGKFEEKKRPLDLLQAFQRANLVQTTLLFVGDGSLKDELHRQASGRGNIRFADFQNQTSMPRTYAAGDVLVLPSHGSEETWGLAINEAMCLARPVIISTHVGCASNLVQPYKNGLVFPAGDVDALAACLKEAFSDLNRLREWGEASRKIVQNYSYAQTTRGLKDALTSLNILPNGITTKANATLGVKRIVKE